MASNLDDEGISGPIKIASFSPPVEASDSTVRQRISYALLFMLASILLLAFIALFIINGLPSSNTDAVLDSRRLIQLLNIVFGPVVTLVSSVVGFYFGANTAKAAANRS